MSVNEKLMTPGTFNVLLNLETTPNSVVNSIEPWGNIVLTPTRINTEEFTDAQIRDMSRYPSELCHCDHRWHCHLVLLFQT